MPEGDPGIEGDNGGFLGRWSRRKTEAAKTADQSAAMDPTADPAILPDAETQGTSPAIEPRDETPAFDVSTLPEIDSLGPGSDFSAFMQTGVPPALKTKALRKLWRVKPELANLDGLVDYGEDLTGSFKVVDHLKTAYEVGRGFLRDQDANSIENSEGEEVIAEVDTTDPPEFVAPNRSDEGQDEVEAGPEGKDSTDQT